MRRIAAPFQKGDYVEFAIEFGRNHHKGDRFKIQRVGSYGFVGDRILWVYELDDNSNWWSGKYFKRVRL